MDRVGFLKPTCLRKIPRQATGDVTENPVEDALQTKAYSACAGYSLDPLKTRVGGMKLNMWQMCLIREDGGIKSEYLCLYHIVVQ